MEIFAAIGRSEMGRCTVVSPNRLAGPRAWRSISGRSPAGGRSRAPERARQGCRTLNSGARWAAGPLDRGGGRRACAGTLASTWSEVMATPPRSKWPGNITPIMVSGAVGRRPGRTWGPRCKPWTSRRCGSRGKFSVNPTRPPTDHQQHLAVVWRVEHRQVGFSTRVSPTISMPWTAGRRHSDGRRLRIHGASACPSVRVVNDEFVVHIAVRVVCHGLAR
jgi:hypothetical protein